MADRPGSATSIRPASTLSRGRRDLIVAVLMAGALFGVDRVTGRHLEGRLVALSRRLGVWYEDRRQPAVTCMPARAVPYDADASATWSVPECWQVEADSILDRTLHVFRDPEARAGSVSILVEPIES